MPAEMARSAPRQSLGLAAVPVTVGTSRLSSGKAVKREYSRQFGSHLGNPGLLVRFAKAAGAGEMLNIHDLKAAYEKVIGHDTSNSTVYNLLARHGWRKLVPRPFHPKRDIAAQNSFKKTVFQMR